MCETPSEMDMHDMVEIDTLVFDIVEAISLKYPSRIELTKST